VDYLLHESPSPYGTGRYLYTTVEILEFYFVTLLFYWEKSKQKPHHENQIQVFPSRHARPPMDGKLVLHTFRGQPTALVQVNVILRNNKFFIEATYKFF